MGASQIRCRRCGRKIQKRKPGLLRLNRLIFGEWEHSDKLEADERFQCEAEPDLSGVRIER